jgi:tRNA threonylcarbamoyl adenosine modification protein (Sua5/YciO/YrdC/YwlC family)
VVAIPTDTVFGLAAIYNILGENTLRDLKRRETKPFSVLFKDINSLNEIVKLTKKEKRFVEKFLPGALTIIFPRCNIGARIIKTPFIHDLFEIINYPLYLTSANLSNQPILTTYTQINEVFPEILVYKSDVLDNLPSTIVQIQDDNITLIRQGAIKFDILKQYFEEL